MSQRILITGASSGFGKLMVHELLTAGHTVVASLRDPDGRNQAPAGELSEAGAHVVEIDVTDDGSVASGVGLALERAGGLDVLVNNAGVGVLGIQEAFTPADFERLFAINVFGVQRVTRAVLPTLRQQGSGLVVFVSSLLGRMVLPFYGPYNATKWAVEAMAESYRVELSAFGVGCALVEPGGYPTSFMDSLVQPSDEAGELGYGEMTAGPKMLFDNFEQALAENPAQDPRLVAEAVRDLVAMEPAQRPPRTVVDRMGMGEHIDPYNEQLEAILRGVYGAFGIEGMLDLGGSE